MMKKALAFLLMAGMLAGLVGCGAEKNEEEPSSTAASSQTAPTVAEDAYIFDTDDLVQGGKNMVWLGPLSMGPDRRISQEFMETMTNKDAYPTVLSKTYVLKFYIEALTRHTNEELKALADFVRENHLAVAVEIGGMKMCSDETPDDKMGQVSFYNEFSALEDFIDEGGRIDYVTTDHAIADLMTSPNSKRPNMTTEQLIQQQAEYFKLLRSKIPNVKLGMIESLGYFQVRKTDGSGALYQRTVGSLKKVDFETYLTTYLKIMKDNGLDIDHFHIDFGFQDVKYDSQGKREYDYGRIKSVEDYCHQAGIDVGWVAGNAFAVVGTGSVAEAQTYDEANVVKYSQSAAEQTIMYFQNYVKAGGTCDYYVFQKWQLYPVQVGPETVPYTTLGIFKTMLEDPLFPRT